MRHVHVSGKAVSAGWQAVESSSPVGRSAHISWQRPGCFFKKTPSRYEVINNPDDDLICFYRVLQNHLEEFLKQFKWLLA